MNMQLIRHILVCVVLAVLPARAAVNERAVLKAIAQVETGDRNDAIGAMGERSAYQFMSYTWRQYTTEPFTRASVDRVLAERIARLHLRSIVARLQQQGRPVTVRAIARAWDPGAPADYAQRVANLVEAAQ